jgi:3-oxoacyl-[acyl-carrier protein] reductase
MGERLKGKVAVVTGGSRGIGLSICKLFAQKGAQVLSGDMSPPVEKIEEVEHLTLNVADNESAQRFFDAAVERYKKIDILVNNAGITRDAMTRKMTDADFDAVIAVNIKGVFNMTRLIGPHMEALGGGSIINISSIVGEYGNIGQINYSASKAAVIGMTKTWAKEFARKGVPVRCNAIAPGYCMTDMLKTVPQELLDKFAAQTMLGRLGQPEEIAAAALFLASDESSYVTGTLLSVNGGMRL